MEVKLSPTEYLLVAKVAGRAGEMLGHRTLLQRVWGPETPTKDYLRTFVQRLRRKLEDDPGRPAVIVTADSPGYRFGPAAG